NLKKVAYFRVENNTAQRTAIKHQFTTNSPHKTGFYTADFRKIPCKNGHLPQPKKFLLWLQHPVKDLRDITHRVHCVLVMHSLRPENPNRSTTFPAHSRGCRNQHQSAH